MCIKTLPLGKLLLFALLSIADLALTWRLVQHSSGQVYESNPLANWWLQHYGWCGLAAFKGITVALVLGLWAIVVRYRPRIGSRMLTFACTAVALVVLYSSLLAGYLGAQPNAPRLEELRQVARESQWLDGQMDQYHRYNLLCQQLYRDVLTQRCTLSEAVYQLACSQKGHNRAWLNRLRGRYPGCSDDECLAAHFLEGLASALMRDPARARQVVQQLEADFAVLYRKPSPCHYDSWLTVGRAGI
jgi:hypothetical protein